MKRNCSIVCLVALLTACANGQTPFWVKEVPKQKQPVVPQPENVVNIYSPQMMATEPDQTSEPKSETEQTATPLHYYYKTNQPGIDAFGAMSGQPGYATGGGLYHGQVLTKHIGDYVQNMTQDLISNMEYLSDKTPVGVTHMALLDSNLQKTNLLGYQLAESFMHELHKFRIPVIDFKATDYIRIGEAGDFLLTRDYLELSNEIPVQYILTGTLTKHQGGYLVNARILGLESKAVVASAQSLIPFYVVDALLPSDSDTIDGVPLVQE